MAQKWHQETRTQRYEALKGIDPKFLRNMRFSKKRNKKGLKMMQANNAKTMSALAEVIKALIKPTEVKPKVPKGASCKLGHLAFLAHPKLGKRACAHMTRGRMLCPLKADAQAHSQAKTQAATPAAVSALALVPTLKGAQDPVKTPGKSLSAGVRTGELV
ncbi:60S ribosomal protein L29 [Sciurus carolinensis]|uniref:Large ribosomal subunit protein eL29 n=1 Tax=Sciurus carolinensis TaxID=30640 RepID=A0AA41T1H5_SCICA|nr:60S ribosomal protein L29 [Sciurus carolinensis]